MTRRWVAVARKDFADAIRSQTLFAITAIYTLLVALILVVPGAIAADFPAGAAIYVVAIPTGLIVPILALVGSYLAIAGERESGTIKLLLGLPPSRRDVVLGKFAGRATVVVSSLLAAFVVGALVIAAVYDGFPADVYVRLATVTSLLALAFVGLAVGLSAGSGSRSGAMTPAIGVYLVFVVLWDLLVVAASAVAGWASIDVSSEVIAAVSLVSPARAYNQLVNSWILAPVAHGQSGQVGQSFQGTDLGGVPMDLPLVVVVCVLLAWAVAPVVLGYWRFDRVDLD